MITDWQRAKLLRKRAAICKTRSGSQRLLIQARYYEQRANFETKKDGPEREPTAEDSGRPIQSLPKWFKDAWSKLRCSECNSGKGCYWYKVSEGNIYTRARLIPSVKRNDFETAKGIMAGCVPLCRKCKDES